MPTQPVVFIHGLWLHADSWSSWIARFRAAGYDPIAPGWPGDSHSVADTRNASERLARKGIDDVVDHFAQIIRSLPTKPIVIGHSFGGLFAQKLLGQDLASAVVAISPAQIRGVLPLPLAQLRSAFPVLGNPLNWNKTVALTAAQFRYGFANAVSEHESAELFAKWTIPGPGRPLFEAALANLNPNSPAKVATDNQQRGPLLMIAAGQDHTVPAVLTRAAYKLYRKSSALTELQEFPDRGHSLTIDSGWEQIADAALTWLKSKGLHGGVENPASASGVNPG
jgi:pimeloyl-ACP methyl ester carboxylesterase